jgi:phosphomannomutase
MREKDVLVGGEETGGVAFKNYIPERDGILSGLLILEMMAMRKKSILAILKDVDREYGTYEYRRLDVKYPAAKRDRLMRHLKNSPPGKVLNKKIARINDADGYKFICEDESWLMLRLSGTEPILRIYAESPGEKRALEMLEFGKKLAEGV